MAQTSKERPAVGSRDDADLVASLIRSHLIALHQANITGNYTVLRDIAGESFRKQFSAADLADIFAPLRREGIDLQLAAILQPEITSAPVLDAGNIMRMGGTFPTKPKPVRFQLAFKVEDKVWKLVGISVEAIDAAQPKPVKK